MEVTEIINSIGGGLPAGVILGLSYIGWKQWQEIQRLNESRLQLVTSHNAERMEDAKRHQEQMAANTETLNRALNYLEGRDK